MSLDILKPLISGVRHLFKTPMTLRYPEQKLALPERERAWIYLIHEKCTGCSICARSCPTRCITMIKTEGTPGIGFPSIEYGKCIFCHYCVYFCPTEALVGTPLYELSSYDKTILVHSPERMNLFPAKDDRAKFRLNPAKPRGASHE